MTLVREYQPTFVLGDGETKEFSYLFEEVSENFIKVIVKHSDDSTYTPVFSVDLDSHKVVFGESETAPLDTDVVCIYRETPDLQDTPFRTLQGYDAKALENILSKIVAMIQELKANGFSTQILQGTPWQLDLLHPADDGASVVVDYNARILKKGLYFQIVSGNLQVSADGNSFIAMPKSADITEFRRLETVLEDLTVIYRLQYKVDGVWYNAESNAEAKADEAVEIAKEARTIATGAKEIADEAKEIAEGIDGKAQQALDNSVEALETAEEAKDMIQNQIIVRSATMPTPSADLVGKNYQYAGTTNALYTHNYIYECVAGETPYTGVIGLAPSTKITFDSTAGNLVEFFSEITPNFPQITHGTFTYDIAGDIWTIVGKDSNENVIFDNYRLYTQDLEDAGFVFLNPPEDYTDGEVIFFAVIFRPRPTNYSWVRVDVQPGCIAEIQALQADITDIQALIPAQASPTNQLGDKNFINSSIATNTANFIGTFNSVAELEAYSGTVTNNDYAFVIGTDSAGNTTYNRYKYTTATTPASWVYEYTLNNSSFTAAQWAAINSGVTASDVSKARSAVQPSDLGNGTITITQGGEIKGSFTTNQATPATIELDQGGGGSGLNVGDIFYTMRNDNELNGAVECNGATYNTTDFIGAQSIGNLLAAGKVPYLSLADYATALTTNGSVGVFGWDGGTGPTAFRVPKLNDIFMETGTAAQIGDFIPAGAPNITGKFSVTNAASGPKGNINATDGCVYADGTTSGAYTTFAGDGNSTSGPKVAHIDASRSSSVYGNSDTIQPKAVRYRAMIQLATATTDEALETCTSVLADVATLKYDYVVAEQLPTAANNYTWFRKYKSGWVEQGGTWTGSWTVGNGTQSAQNITLPVAMQDGEYHPLLNFFNMIWIFYGSRDLTTTGFSVIAGGYNNSRTINKFNWRVSGMSAS